MPDDHADDALGLLGRDGAGMIAKVPQRRKSKGADDAAATAKE